MKYLLVPARLCMDIFINFFFWTYYTVGFVVFFLPVYIAGFLLLRKPQYLFQRLNHVFYRLFFFLSRAIIPGLSISIPDNVRSIRSSVIICNHISYIDPILLISLFPRHKTIVKGEIFKIPLFGWFLKNSGYIPFSVKPSDSIAMMEVVHDLEDFFDRGGNLFVFPEGTRMPRGTIGSFQKGAFSLARRCRAPVEMLYIRNTDRLMKPGNLWYSTCFRNEVAVERMGRIEPDYGADDFSLKSLITKVRQRYV